jgi:hypothetical protein
MDDELGDALTAQPRLAALGTAAWIIGCRVGPEDLAHAGLLQGVEDLRHVADEVGAVCALGVGRVVHAEIHDDDARPVRQHIDVEARETIAGRVPADTGVDERDALVRLVCDDVLLDGARPRVRDRDAVAEKHDDIAVAHDGRPGERNEREGEA